MNKQEFEKQIDRVSHLYESIKDALYLCNGARLPMTERRKCVDALKQLQDLRDLACVSLRENHENDDLAEPSNLHEGIRQADVHLSRCLFEMNRPLRNPGMECDEKKVKDEALKAYHKLGKLVAACADAQEPFDQALEE